MSHREETPGKTQDKLERLCFSAGLGTPRDPTGRAGGSGEVWASLTRPLPPALDKQYKMDGWMDGYFSI